jgi:dipicolinate synthase subunit A
MSRELICVVGEDKRQFYIGEYLEEHGYAVVYHPVFQPNILESIRLLIGPVSFYRGGRLIPEVAKACSTYGVTPFNYLDDEDFLLENARLTAEGFLSYLIENTPFSLAEANILLLGMGRCGQAINEVLTKLSCRVESYDLIPEELEDWQRFNVVINTIPAQVIGRKQLQALREDCILFDIATPPGGYAEESLEALHRQVIVCLGIPGTMSPKSAGYCIGRCSIAFMNAASKANNNN